LPPTSTIVNGRQGLGLKASGSSRGAWWRPCTVCHAGSRGLETQLTRATFLPSAQALPLGRRSPPHVFSCGRPAALESNCRALCRAAASPSEQSRRTCARGDARAPTRGSWIACGRLRPGAEVVGVEADGCPTTTTRSQRTLQAPGSRVVVVGSARHGEGANQVWASPLLAPGEAPAFCGQPDDGARAAGAEDDCCRARLCVERSDDRSGAVDEPATGDHEPRCWSPPARRPGAGAFRRGSGARSGVSRAAEQHVVCPTRVPRPAAEQADSSARPEMASRS
jgi:hypothetical protein